MAVYSGAAVLLASWLFPWLSHWHVELGQAGSGAAISGRTPLARAPGTWRGPPGCPAVTSTTGGCGAEGLMAVFEDAPDGGLRTSRASRSFMQVSALWHEEVAVELAEAEPAEAPPPPATAPAAPSHRTHGASPPALGSWRLLQTVPVQSLQEVQTAALVALEEQGISFWLGALVFLVGLAGIICLCIQQRAHFQRSLQRLRLPMSVPPQRRSPGSSLLPSSEVKPSGLMPKTSDVLQTVVPASAQQAGAAPEKQEESPGASATPAPGTPSTYGTATTSSAGSVPICPELCYGFLVPDGNECVLVAKRHSPANVDFLDTDGNPVLTAIVRRPLRWDQAEEEAISTAPWDFSQPAAIALYTPPPSEGFEQRDVYQIDRSAFALCRSATTAGGSRHVFMYKSNGQFFGNITKDRVLCRYVLNTSQGDDGLAVEGIFADHTFVISSRRRLQIADTELCRVPFSQEPFYRVRCTRGADVGLIICCLVAVDEMESLQ